MSRLGLGLNQGVLGFALSSVTRTGDLEKNSTGLLT
ncbi:hypothetical protein EDP1_3972 [Pseudomonas putida S610]|nr:hypothetical protein EDP1_3972 [Pseudomonas putida S610]